MNFVLKSYQGYTLLHEAAADGNLSAIKFLVKNGADLALHGPCGQTAAGWCEERFVINFPNNFRFQFNEFKLNFLLKIVNKFKE